MMEVICECGHKISDHEESQGGCWYHYFGGSCYCNLLPETVEARYWARVMRTRYITKDEWCKKLIKERNTLKKENESLIENKNYLKIRLWSQYCKKCASKFDNPHASQYCPNCGKKMVWNPKNGEPLTHSELQEELRMCQLALKTADRAHTELASYTKIAVDAIKKALESGIWMREYPSNTAVYNDLQEALDKIKGKF